MDPSPTEAPRGVRTVGPRLATPAVASAVVVLLCVLACVSARPASAAPWQPAVQLAEAGTYNQDVQVKFDGAGDALAVWRHSGGSEVVQVAEKPAGGTWQAPVDISSSSYPPESPQIAVDPAGDAIVVWSAYDGSKAAVWAAVRDAGGAWQTPVKISEPGFDALRARVAIDPTGAAVVVWERREGSPFEFEREGVVQAAKMTAAGAWGAPTTLSPPSGDQFAPDVAFDSRGSAAVVWQRYDGSAGMIEGDETGPGGAWQGAVGLSEPATNAIEAHIAGDADGGLVAVWARYAGSSWTIQGSRRAADGSWAPAVDLSPAGQTALSPQLAVAAGGTAIAVWQIHVAQYIWMVQGAEGSGDAWGVPVNLSTADEIGEPQVAVDPAGDAVVSWVFHNQYPQVATKTAHGSWQAPIDVPQSPGSYAKVAVDPKGDAIVVSEHPSFTDPESGVQATEHEAIRLAVAGTGSGTGTVSSDPAGIDCGTACSSQFDDDSTVVLTADPAAGSVFDGWSGACTGTGTCTVALSASRSVTADFELLPPRPGPRPQPETRPEPQSVDDPPPVDEPRPAFTPPPSPVCNAVAASAGTFVPSPGPGRAVAGVRAQVRVAAPSELLVEPTLSYTSGGRNHRVRLPYLSLHTAAERNLRMPIPAAVRKALPVGSRVELSLRISVTPDHSPSCGPNVSRHRVKAVVMRVLAAPQPGVSRK